MSKEISIDVRDLPAPEPMEKIVNALGEVEIGTYIKMIHRQRPNMLFPILKQNGFDFLVKEDGEEILIFIFSKKDKDLKKELEDVLQ